VILANVAIGKSWAKVATPIVAAYAPLITVLIGGLDLFASQFGTAVLSSDLSAQARFAVDAGFVVTGAAAAGFVFRPIRRDMAGFLPIDPDNPVHALALSLALVFFGTQVTFIVFTDVLAVDRASPPLSIADLFLNEVPFLILALAGVGLFIRRNAAQAESRLGLVVPAWWHVALALAAAGAFFALASGSDALNHAWSPDVARKVDATTQHLFGQLNSPVGIAAVALIPGICEEFLFRGALQPRIGLVATALLFTAIHTQYGLSMDTAAIFLIAIGLGLIRRFANTTASCACHVSYNLLAGIGIAGAAVGPAVAIEAVLVAMTAYGIWSSRQKGAPAAGEAS
jgi:membrane protease YdiL (CAAX protease family)